MVSAIIIGIFIVLFIAMGMVFYSGKGSFLIAGYNTMSKEEKEEYDTVSLCRFIGKMLFSLSFSMVFWALSELFEIMWLFILGLVLFMSIVIFMLIYVNTGNRFKK